jgi:hypothetical protein
MESKIRGHLDSLFSEAPPSKRAYELKEEMIQNLTESYNDFVAGGKQPDVAYDLTIASIGDVSELIIDLEESNMKDPVEAQNARKKSALLTSAAIMLYILSPLPLILLGISGNPIVGLIFLFAFVAAATGMLIYNGMSNPKYVRNDDTVVEEFKEWQSEKAGKHSARAQISGAVWSITVALYFIISFAFDCWAVSWIIFIVGIAVQQVIRALIAIRNER